MKKGNVILGLIMIFIGANLLLEKFNIIPQFDLWKVFFTLIMAGVIVDGVRNKNLFKILVPAAVIFNIIYDFSYVPVIIIVLGICVIFPGGIKKAAGEVDEEMKNYANGSYEDTVKITNDFSTSIQYIHTRDLAKGKIINRFGNLTVYMDNASLKNGKGSLFVNNSFGTVDLYIAKEWCVEKRINRSFGSVTEHGHWIGNGDVILTITGDSSFGKMNIYYI